VTVPGACIITSTQVKKELTRVIGVIVFGVVLRMDILMLSKVVASGSLLPVARQSSITRALVILAALPLIITRHGARILIHMLDLGTIVNMSVPTKMSATIS
jgi:hypothetical protein